LFPITINLAISLVTGEKDGNLEANSYKLFPDLPECMIKTSQSA